MLAAAAAGVIAVSVVQHLAYGWHEPVGSVNLDSEMSIGTWFQTGMLLLAAALAGLIAASERRASKPYAGHWLVAAVVLVLLSIDEALALHEKLIDPLRSALDASGILYFAWVVPGAALVAIFAAAYARFALQLPPASRKLLLLGAGLYVWGALGTEALNGAYGSANGLENLTYRVLTDLEEAFELLGMIIVVYALLTFLGGVSIRVGAIAGDSAAGALPRRRLASSRRPSPLPAAAGAERPREPATTIGSGSGQFGGTATMPGSKFGPDD